MGGKEITKTYFYYICTTNIIIFLLTYPFFIMKKVLTIVMALIAMSVFVSCQDSPDSLSASRAKSLITDELKRVDGLVSTHDLTIGYFECNSNDVRYQYRQLAANELITYKCEVVKKIENKRKTRRVQRSYGGYYSYYDTEYYWENDTIDTYFITVALTEKGQKLIYEKKEAEPTDDEEYLENDEVDKSKFPEFGVPEIEFPEAATPGVAVEEEVDNDEPYETETEVNLPEGEAPSAWELAKSKENTETVTLKAIEIKVLKVRNIFKTADFKATGEVVIENDEVTPVGRIFLEAFEGERHLMGEVNFRYYQDKGWQLDR